MADSQPPKEQPDESIVAKPSHGYTSPAADAAESAALASGMPESGQERINLVADATDTPEPIALPVDNYRPDAIGNDLVSASQPSLDERSSEPNASPQMAGREPEDASKVMTVVEHLDELRVRIIRSLLVLIVAFFGALAVGKEAVRILEKPAGGIQFQALSLEEPLLVYFKVSFYLAIILACPWILFEICQFIAPGLRPNERRILSPIVFGSPLLFVAGATFAYLCVLPPMLSFFNSFGQGMSPIHQRLDFYISLVSSIMMYMGLCFQLPIIIFALALAGLVNSNQLIKIWRYAVFGASVVALIITPDPTAFSMLIVMGALIGLYFLSVALLKLFGK